MILNVTISSNNPLRWVIENDSLEFWTGTEFDKNKTKALVYADANLACCDVQTIMKDVSLKEGRKHFRLIAPVWIDVYAHSEIAVMDIARYLGAASEYRLNMEMHGAGPHGSVVLPVIHWELIELDEQFTDK